MERGKQTPDKKKESAGFWDKMGLVAEIASRCRAMTSTREMYVGVLELIQKIVSFDAATLYLLDSDTGCLTEKATLGKRVEALDFLSLGTGKGLSGWVAESGQPILLTERSGSSGFDPEHDFASVMSVPLLVEDDVMGVLNLGCQQPDALEQKQIAAMTVVVDQLAISIERLASEEKMQAAGRALVKAREDLQKAREKADAAARLVTAVELSAEISREINDPLTVIIGHVQCVLAQGSVPDQKGLSRLKRIEASAMRISEANRRLVRIGALCRAEDLSRRDTAQLAD